MAGMPRAGTTYVYEALRSHPGVYLPYRKELSFFSMRYDRGESWYESFFNDSKPGQVCADISPDYFVHADANVRIRRYAPDAKIVLAIRDPASWAVSFHRHLQTYSFRVPKFADFLKVHRVPDNRLFRFKDNNHARQFHIQDGLVRTTIEQYRKAFGRSLLLYSFSRFAANPLEVMRSIEAFLCIPHILSAANLPTGAINAGRRRNSRVFSFVASREEIVWGATRLLPHALLRSLKARYHRLSTPAQSAPPDPEFDADLALARERLAEDALYISKLFGNGSIVYGDGTLPK